MFVGQHVSAVHRHLYRDSQTTFPTMHLGHAQSSEVGGATRQFPSSSTEGASETLSHLELVFQDEDDELKRGSAAERHQVEDLLAAPALLLQRVANNALLVQTRVEMERHVSSRLHAAATREVYLEPVRRSRGQRVRVEEEELWRPHKSGPNLSASDGTEP